VQILVNKADRLSPDELATVMGNVAESLEETGLRSWSVPIALSARLALQGKLGDAAALATSNWEAVQRLLDEELIARSDELKERGLRRRGGRVVSELLDRARVHANEEHAKIEAARTRSQDLALRAAKLEREADDAAQVVAGALLGAAADWKRDLDVVVTGRDAAQAEADPVLTRYRIDRAITRLAQPLARVLCSVAGDGASPARSTPDEGASGATEEDLLPLCRAVVRTFAATGGRSGALVPLTRSAIASLVEHLLELAAAPPERGRAEGQVAELEAIGAALA
jgi:hypothetical protein